MGNIDLSMLSGMGNVGMPGGIGTAQKRFSKIMQGDNVGKNALLGGLAVSGNAFGPIGGQVTGFLADNIGDIWDTYDESAKRRNTMNRILSESQKNSKSLSSFEAGGLIGGIGGDSLLSGMGGMGNSDMLSGLLNNVSAFAPILKIKDYFIQKRKEQDMDMLRVNSAADQAYNKNPNSYITQFKNGGPINWINNIIEKSKLENNKNIK